MYEEDDLLPLSALQHLMFCERQCALIHIERMWSDNSLTLEGSHMHSRVDETGPRREARGETIVVRGVALRSLRLGLSGRADVVEFHPAEGEPSAAGATTRAPSVPGATPQWEPFPVDYKHGKPKRDPCDEVQLCAQALCLEEMLHVRVPNGALFYGKIKRRHEVAFEKELRLKTEAAARRLHQLVAAGATPRAVREPKCEQCSLVGQCLPDAMAPRRSASRYLRDSIRSNANEERGKVG